MVRCVTCLVFLVLAIVGCSAGEPVHPESATVEPTIAPADESVSTTADETADDTADNREPTAVPAPALADEDVTSVVEVAVGDQIEDAQGNLIAIYAGVAWPQAFDDLTDAAQAQFPFFADVNDAIGAPLIVLDVGMCAAGLDASGFGTAEFFVHDSADDVLSIDPVSDRGVLVRHPVVQPGFQFPAVAECHRGWLPVLWSGQEVPTIARYVVTTRASADAEIERHVYQWDIEGEFSEPAIALNDEATSFDMGQTITFNEGRLAETTIVVDGWTELVGKQSQIAGTRVVAVSLTYCPSSLRLPEFGLAVDGWNLVAAQARDDLLGALSAGDPSQNCFDGWLEFVVPHGGVPTGFFASDGVNAVTGYAEWSLADAALPTP